MDSIYSFPGLILAIAFAAMLGPGVVNITLSVAVIYIPTYFRLVRGQTLSIKQELYVEAARAIGAPRRTILARYIFPNVIATVVVVFSLNIADAIMTEAALSYIGLGLPAGIPDWHGPVHGQEVPALRSLVDDHLPRRHDQPAGPGLHHAGRGPVRDPQPEAAGKMRPAARHPA
jgi:ABC-type antimicrobial peptide transport system permease subunit